MEFVLPCFVDRRVSARSSRSAPRTPLATLAARAILLLLGCAFLTSFAACKKTDEDRLEEVRELQANSEMVASIPILIELIESGNRDGEVLYRYGRALSLTGKRDRSVWALDSARDDPDWFVAASQQLALDASDAGNYEFAIDVFQRLHEEAPEALDEDLFALLLEARVLINSQDRFEEALELIDSILERFPEEETAVRLKAVALLALKRPDEAYELLRATNVSPASGVDGEQSDTEKEKLAADPKPPGEKVAKAGGDLADDPAEEAGDADLYMEIEDEQREAYWCSIRVTFKREAGQSDEAVRIADECLERFPSDRGLITQAVKLFSELARYDRVLEILERAHEKSPDDAEIRNALVEFLGRIGRTKDVEGILRKTIDDAVAAGRGAAPETAASWVELAGFLMGQDRVGEALLAFDAANQIIGDAASPDLLLREAEALIRAQQFDEALAMAEKSPVEVHRLMLRGRIAFERGQYPEALEHLGKAALQWPDNAPIRFYRARAAEGVGDFDLAVEEYRQAIRSDSRLAEARERLAKLHLAEGDFREAAAILTFQSPREPSTPSAGMRILMVEVDTMRGVEPDLEIPPDEDHTIERVRAETIRSIGSGLRKRANAKIAAGVLAELEKSSPPPFRGAFLRERVDLMTSAGELEPAVSEARKGLKARPEDHDSQLALGHALVASGLELEEAGRLLRGVVERRPSDADGWTFLGDLETRRGNLAAATESYERALKLAPEQWSALAPRLVSMTAAGQSDEAIQRLEVFVASTAPYDARAALELARRLPKSDATRERRIRLAEQAIRFGAGREAVDLLAELDPAAAEKYLPDAATAATPSVPETEIAKEKSAAVKEDAAERSRD